MPVSLQTVRQHSEEHVEQTQFGWTPRLISLSVKSHFASSQGAARPSMLFPPRAAELPRDGMIQDASPVPSGEGKRDTGAALRAAGA